MTRPALTRRTALLGSAVFGCGLVLALGGLLLNSKGVSPRLALTLQQQGDRLAINWNRANAMVRNARVGVLQIHDGAQERKVYLTPEQISDGSVLYMPQSDDVSFRLEVYGQNGGTESQGLRLLDGTTRIAPPQSVDDNAPVPLALPPKPRITRVVRPKPPEKRFRAPEVLSAAPPKAGNAPDGPPVIDADWAGASPFNVDTLFQGMPPPPPPPKPVSRVVAYIPARILQKVVPQVNTLGSAVHPGDMIELVATVDKEGDVAGIRLVSPKTISPLVLQAVVRAALQWKFAPALLHGAPVESEHRITFQFSQRP